MKAIVVHQHGGPEVMRLEEVPDPTPDAGEAVVRIRAAGVNPVDGYIRSGMHARKATPPFTPGFDGAGEIESIGAEVDGFRVGDRVYIAGAGAKAAGVGTYAERALCVQSQLHHLPSNVTFAQGAALGVPYATAYRALIQRARARPTETVLVHGATGGVGIATVELAHALGCVVIGTGGTEAGLETVGEHGADMTANHREPNYTDAIMKATGGRGVDVIIEMAAHINLDRDLTLLGRRGRVVVVGSRARIEINPRDAMGRDADIRGMTLFNMTDREFDETHAALVAGLTSGTLRPVVGREMPLADAGKAHEAVMEPGAHGKIVLVP
jgi:NADPH2:quinone reductase